MRMARSRSDIRSEARAPSTSGRTFSLHSRLAFSNRTRNFGSEVLTSFGDFTPARRAGTFFALTGIFFALTGIMPPSAFDHGINGKGHFRNHRSRLHFFRRVRIEAPSTIQRFLGPTRLHFTALFLQYSFTVASVTSLPSKSDVSRAVYQLFGSIPFVTFACVSGYTPHGQQVDTLSYSYLSVSIRTDRTPRKKPIIDCRTALCFWLKSLKRQLSTEFPEMQQEMTCAPFLKQDNDLQPSGRDFHMGSTGDEFDDRLSKR